MTWVAVNVKYANAIVPLQRPSAHQFSTTHWPMGAQFKLDCVENLKIIRPVLVDVAKAKMICSHGSIAIAMFAAMVTLPNLERAEDHSNFVNNFVTRISSPISM